MLTTVNQASRRVRSFWRYLPGIALAAAAALLLTASAAAQDVDSSDVGMSFDDIVDEPPPQAGGGLADKIHISGRFDLNYEATNPLVEDAESSSQFRNYHKFVFLKVTPNDKVTLDAEILDLSYYEIKYQLTNRFEAKLGKIWVPFGATPFHHYYGGRQGDPFTGLLLPNVWAEFGATISGTVYTGTRVNVASDFYVIRGFDNQLGDVISFTGGGSDGLLAVGHRTRVGVGTKLAFWGSVLYNQFGEIEAENDEDEMAGQLLLWGGDVLVDYGLFDFPFLRDLQFRAAFARAEVKDELLVDPSDNPDGWYIRYGDYAEVTYRGLPWVRTRLRYGTFVDFDDALTGNDSHNWEFALLSRINQNLSLLAQWQVNLEEINEVDNDLFRVQLVFEF